MFVALLAGDVSVGIPTPKEEPTVKSIDLLIAPLIPLRK